MNSNDNKFSAGFMLGLILGGGLVFLIGTKTGKNLLKIISDQGLDGLLNLLEEYNIADLEEYEEVDERQDADIVQEAPTKANGQAVKKDLQEEHGDSSPKHRFFKRVRK